MTIITDKNTLKIEVAAYMHRTDLNDRLDGFVDLATKRIGRDLRSMFNQVVLDPFEVAEQLQAFPDGFRAVKELSYQNGNRRVQLLSASSLTLAAFPATSSSPQRYRVHGNLVEIKPFAARDYRLIYWEEPAELVDDGDTNLVLDNYPYLYLYGCLVEANFYVQNGGARDLSLSTYTGEVEEINLRNATSDAGGSPMTIGH